MYNDIISLENLYEAWSEFICDKKSKKDIAVFSLNLSDNIFLLHEDLKQRTYKHGAYEAFTISDPKPRNIHKAKVRDRLLHHAIYRVLYPFFNKKFIYDSYSCRYVKGTHRAVNRFKRFFYKVSQSNSRTCWVLKCDIKKCFASIDQNILMTIIKKYIFDIYAVNLLERVVVSFQSTNYGKGLPLGNLTSQLLINIYMNEFDQWMKHTMKIKFYIRYADDFIIMDHHKCDLIILLTNINNFLNDNLKLSLHPNKVLIRTFSSGIDFLGWVNFPYHRVLRTSTKNRMFKNIKNKNNKIETIQSYLGLLKHGNCKILELEIKNIVEKPHKCWTHTNY